VDCAGWFLFKPHSRASVCGATACSERPRNPNGRTVAIAPRHRRFIQDAGCRLTWGPSSPRKRPLPRPLPGSPQPSFVLPSVAVAARPSTRQDRPRCPCSRTSASALLREVPLNRYPSQIRRRVGMFGSSSSILTPQTRQRARLPPGRCDPLWGSP
jgi:hypothetical protein